MTDSQLPPGVEKVIADAQRDHADAIVLPDLRRLNPGTERFLADIVALALEAERDRVVCVVRLEDGQFLEVVVTTVAGDDAFESGPSVVFTPRRDEPK